MKKIVLIVSLIVLSAMSTFARDPEILTVEIGQQKVSAEKITVKFISVVEDSRCPEGTNCIWAGNAKVRVSLKKGRKATITMDLDSTKGHTSVGFQGYDVAFVDLTPHPSMTKRAVRSQQLTVSITKRK